MCRHGDCNWDTSEGGLSASSPTRAQKLPCSPRVYTHPYVICRKFHRWSPFSETCTANKCPRERSTEYQKGKGHRVSKERVLACSREWPSAEDPRRDPENGPVLRIPAVTSSLLIAMVYYQGGYHRLVPLPLPTLQSPHHPPWPS